ncbi:MAG: hypothetical protein V7742_21205 [Halioglobus sp.]
MTWNGKAATGRAAAQNENSATHWGGTQMDITNPPPPERRYPGRVLYGQQEMPAEVWTGTSIVSTVPDEEPVEPAVPLEEGVWTGTEFVPDPEEPVAA